MFNKYYFVYITTNYNRTTYYVGVTNDLAIRLRQHFENSGKPQTFAGRYYCYHLVYYEYFSLPSHAIEREKAIERLEKEQKGSIN